MASATAIARVAAADIELAAALKDLQRARRASRGVPVGYALVHAVNVARTELKAAQAAADAEDDAHMGHEAAEAMRRRDAQHKYCDSIHAPFTRKE